MLKRCLLVSFFFCLFSALSTPAQEFDIRSAGHLGGHYRGLALSKAVTAVGSGNSVVLYDPQNPSEKISTIPLPEQVEDIFIENDLCVMLLTGDRGMFIYDISDPEQPDSLSHFPLDAGWGKKVFVSDARAFVANVFTKELVIIDISSPQTPVFLSKYECIARDVHVADDTVFVAAGEGLIVLDVSDPNQPEQIGLLNSGNYHSIDIEDNRAVLAGGLKSVLVDISEPQQPELLSTFEVRDAGKRQTVYTIALDGRAVYAVNTVGIVYVLDISNPQNPISVADIDLIGDPNPHSVWIEDENSLLYAVVSSSDRGFQIIDLADISNPLTLQTIAAPSDVRALTVHQDYLYVASWNHLWAYQLADPAQPRFLNMISEYPNSERLNAFGSLLFTVDDAGTVVCFDISNPADFVRVSRYQPQTGQVKEIFPADDILYACVQTDAGGHLDIVDYSVPSSPAKLGSVDLRGEPRDVVADSNRVVVAYYLSDYDKGFQVFEVSDPEFPLDKGSGQCAFKPYCIGIKESTVVIGSSGRIQWALQTFAISDSAAPVSVDLKDGAGMIKDLDIQGNAVFASIVGNSVNLYELRDGTLVFKKTCHSPGSGQITTLPPDLTGTGYTYTQEGSPTPEGFGGEKGIVIQIFKIPPKLPKDGAALILGMGGAGGSHACPPDSGEKVVIANASLFALYDSWQVNSISFVSTGNGQASDIDKAYLEFNGRRIESDVQPLGDGFRLQFQIGKILQEGETLNMTLFFSFSFYQDGERGVVGATDGVRLYGVYCAANMVGAQWLTMDEGGKLPAIPQKVVSPVTQVAPVWKIAQSENIPFPSIQFAIDDVRTKAGDKLLVCPCKLKENVIVHKGVTIYSDEKDDQAIVGAAEQNRHVFDIQTGDVEIRNLTIEKAGRMAGIHFSEGDYDSCLIVDNTIQKNLNGISIDGGVALNFWGNRCIHNHQAGIAVRNGVWLTIGGFDTNSQTAVKRRNILSGNAYGLYVSGNTARTVLVTNNSIGLSEDGRVMPNEIGVYLDNTAGRLIGLDSTRNALPNVISGNRTAGVLIDRGSYSNYITNNYIGTLADGKTAAANGSGIIIQNGANNNVVSGNVVSGNVDAGIVVGGEEVSRNHISGNRIGVDAEGMQSVPNRIGIYLSSGALSTNIGTEVQSDETSYRGNVISGNDEIGIWIERNVHFTLVVNNMIGLDRFGMFAIPNTTGIYLSSAVRFNIIGDKDFNGDGYNVISGNLEDGIRVEGFSESGRKFSGNCITWNYIGTDAGGKRAIANKRGVFLSSGAQGISVCHNVIGGNQIGVDIQGMGTSGNNIYSNKIGYNAVNDAVYKITNHIGIRIGAGASHNRVGDLPWKNFIAANDTGIVLTGSRNRVTFYNIIKQNRIGTGENNQQGLGNGVGISTSSFTRNNLIVHNQFRYNEIHLIGKNDDNNIFQNDFRYGLGPSTALRLDGSMSGIMGNLISLDAGDAIHTSNQATPVIEKNNIYDNQGHGLVNTDASVSVFAQNNWWGDASGPSGEGPGSGDEISGKADISGWRTEPIDLVLNAALDTLFIPQNHIDSLQISVKNWQSSDGIAEIDVSDSLNWSIWPNMSLSLQHQGGADTVLIVHPPSDAQTGSGNKIELLATLKNSSISDKDSFYVFIYNSGVYRIHLQPDTTVLHPGESVLFNAVALNKMHQPLSTDFIWQGEGGEIDSTGLYTAGPEPGHYRVMVFDEQGLTRAEARVEIRFPAAVETEQSQPPEEFRLYSNYPNPFNAETVIAYDLPQPSDVVLKIYDILGRERMTVIDRIQAAGHSKIHIHAGDWPAGLYIYHLQTTSGNEFGKMILLK